MQKKKLKELNEQENIIDKLAPKGSKEELLLIYVHRYIPILNRYYTT